MLTIANIVIPANLYVPIPNYPIFKQTIVEIETRKRANPNQKIQMNNLPVSNGIKNDKSFSLFHQPKEENETVSGSSLKEPKLRKRNKKSSINSQIKKRVTQLVKNIQKYKNSIKCNRQAYQGCSKLSLVKSLQKRNKNTLISYHNCKEELDRYLNLIYEDISLSLNAKDLKY